MINTPKDTITNCTELNDPDYKGKLGLPPCFEVEDALWGTIVGLFAIGGLLGGVIGGYLADLLGRKQLMMLNNIIFALGSLLMGFSTSTAMLGVGRVIVGMGSGISTLVIPLYIGEIAPINFRGSLGVLTQLSVTIGIFVSQIISIFMNSVPAWRWLLSMSLFIGAAQLILLPACVNSPRWLVMKGNNTEAKEALKKLRVGNTETEVNEELDSILEGQRTSGDTVTYLDLFRNPSLRKPLIVGLTLQAIQQFSGINAVFYYSGDIFEKSAPEQAEILTASVGLLNVLLTFLSIVLMDKAGRRALLIFGEIGMIVVAILYTIAFSLDINWLGIVCTYAYVSAFAVGLGPIPFLILVEIFPTSAVGKAASLAIPINWGSNYLVAQLFPIMSDAISDYAFLPFAAVLTLAFFFTLKFVPETKGKSLEEISKFFQ